MPKSPGTVQDYSLDVTAWAEDAGETVTSFTAMVSAAGSYLSPLVAVAQALLPNNILTVLLSGGVSVTDCAVTFNIVTARRTLQLTCWIVVSSISATKDRYGNTAVIASVLDPATAGQITALGQGIAAEAASRTAEDTSLAGSIAALAETIADLSTGADSTIGSIAAVAGNLHDFQQSITSQFQNLVVPYTEFQIIQILTSQGVISTIATLVAEQFSAGSGIVGAAIAANPAMITAALNAQITAGAIPEASSFAGPNMGLCSDGDFLCTGNSQI